MSSIDRLSAHIQTSGIPTISASSVMLSSRAGQVKPLLGGGIRVSLISYINKCLWSIQDLRNAKDLQYQRLLFDQLSYSSKLSNYMSLAFDFHFCVSNKC